MRSQHGMAVGHAEVNGVWADWLCSLYQASMVLDDDQEGALSSLSEEVDLTQLWRGDVKPSFRQLRADLFSMHSSKAGGPDGLHVGLLRQLHEEVVPLLKCVVDSAYHHCQWPHLWKGGLASRLPKSSGGTAPEANRCITLTNVLGRVAQKSHMRLLRDACCDRLSPLQHSQGHLAGTTSYLQTAPVGCSCRRRSFFVGRVVCGY